MTVMVYWGLGWVGVAVLVVAFFRGSTLASRHAVGVAEVSDDEPIDLAG